MTETIIKEIKSMESAMATMQRKIAKLTRQRDEAIGRAREYRSVVYRYQKDLAALRGDKTIIVERRVAE